MSVLERTVSSLLFGSSFARCDPYGVREASPTPSARGECAYSPLSSGTALFRHVPGSASKLSTLKRYAWGAHEVSMPCSPRVNRSDAGYLYDLRGDRELPDRWKLLTYGCGAGLVSIGPPREASRGYGRVSRKYPRGVRQRNYDARPAFAPQGYGLRSSPVWEASAKAHLS